MTTKIESSNPDRYWLKPGFGTIFENTDRKDAKDPPRLAFFTLPDGSQHVSGIWPPTDPNGPTQTGGRIQGTDAKQKVMTGADGVGQFHIDGRGECLKMAANMSLPEGPPSQ